MVIEVEYESLFAHPDVSSVQDVILELLASTGLNMRDVSSLVLLMLDAAYRSRDLCGYSLACAWAEKAGGCSSLSDYMDMVVSIAAGGKDSWSCSTCPVGACVARIGGHNKFIDTGTDMYRFVGSPGPLVVSGKSIYIDKLYLFESLDALKEEQQFVVYPAGPTTMFDLSNMVGESIMINCNVDVDHVRLFWPNRGLDVSSSHLCPPRSQDYSIIEMGGTLRSLSEAI